MLQRVAARLPLLGLLGLLGLATACGSTAAPPPTGPAIPPGHFVQRSGGSRQFVALISGDDITGPEINLTRYVEGAGHAIRGQASRSTVDLMVEGQRASGPVGNTRMDVTTTRTDDSIYVEGIIRGAPSQFTLDPKVLDGRIANCTYHLTWTGTAYMGSRGCGSAAVVEVEVPNALRAWGDAAFGAMVGLLLSTP